MDTAVCFFRDTIYCWNSQISADLIPCGQLLISPKDLSLPVCSCDRGRLTGASKCYCPIGTILTVCENSCRDNHDCNLQQNQFAELSDYVKVLLGLVTVIFFVTLYVAIKRYIRRRNRRNAQSSQTLVNSVTGCLQHVHHHEHVWYNTTSILTQPPSYEEVNSTPPPYELVVKFVDNRISPIHTGHNAENNIIENTNRSENTNLSTRISVGI